MAWVYLIVGGLFEVGFTTCLNKVGDVSKVNGYFNLEVLLWFIGFLFSVSLSMYLLYRASLSLPMGTAYAVWAGIGAVGTVLMGILFFKDPIDFWRIFFIFTLIASIVGLKLVSA